MGIEFKQETRPPSTFWMAESAGCTVRIDDHGPRGEPGVFTVNVMVPQKLRDLFMRFDACSVGYGYTGFKRFPYGSLDDARSHAPWCVRTVLQDAANLLLERADEIRKAAIGAEELAGKVQ